MSIFIALLLGVLAGVVDALPMLKNPNVPRFSVYSTFAQWIFIGLVIPFVDWDVAPWLKGLLLGFLGMLPTMITVFFRNRKALIPTAIMASFLGMVIAVVGAHFIS
ncbi:hypothetical protein [Bdellovibrio bacteriovorus]|uniref:hypothetical protein n=1 Tax=Bdellovibrio bacteriovorus TaxID=959 RepID=UPI0035A73F08